MKQYKTLTPTTGQSPMLGRKGFTLVELMIVVAIIGILAAIAIPNFHDMQYRAKRAELPSNIDGIKTAEIAYEASFDTFVTTAWHPRIWSAVNKEQVPWTTGSSFDTLGWAPDGDVRGAYRVFISTTGFTIIGYGDMDGDGNMQIYQANSLNRNPYMVMSEHVY